MSRIPSTLSDLQGLDEQEFHHMIDCRRCGCLFNSASEECPMCGWKITYLGAIQHKQGA